MGKTMISLNFCGRTKKQHYFAFIGINVLAKISFQKESRHSLRRCPFIVGISF